jgi:hypothetical protein
VGGTDPIEKRDVASAAYPVATHAANGVEEAAKPGRKSSSRLAYEIFPPFTTGQAEAAFAPPAANEELSIPHLDPSIANGVAIVSDAWPETFLNDRIDTSIHSGEMLPPGGKRSSSAPFADSFSTQPGATSVPEPFAGALFCTGLLGIWWMKRGGRGPRGGSSL